MLIYKVLIKIKLNVSHMDIEKIVEWILKNGSSYPGKHNYPTERTSDACKPLEPKS